ncbi:Uu.00g093810.m01.CDS01 [Anthostomella pinea]|uniref:Transcription elongation factor SPT4 n=1 Tax=Anthostomella pinea TaxID=933095 RepID=A0AAI8VNJ5_9PEZI|nr:Uu.00g093810.m01.CDS01 [Anthostomella pinea]
MTSNYIAPGQQRYSRACMVCSIIMLQSRFKTEGCPNCPFLDLKGSTDNIEACTSGVFEGVTVIADPKVSWIAKWQRLDEYVAGVYAMKVSGSLPEELKSQLIEEGHPLYPRDANPSGSADHYEDLDDEPAYVRTTAKQPLSRAERRAAERVGNRGARKT